MQLQQIGRQGITEILNVWHVFPCQNIQNVASVGSYIHVP